MFKSIRTAAAATVATIALAGLATSAFADETQWQKDHPRRTEVNSRLANQNNRIKTERKVIASNSPYKVSYPRLAPSLVNDEHQVEAALSAVRAIA